MKTVILVGLMLTTTAAYAGGLDFGGDNYLAGQRPLDTERRLNDLEWQQDQTKAHEMQQQHEDNMRTYDELYRPRIPNSTGVCRSYQTTPGVTTTYCD